MNIHLACVGKLKSGPFKELEKEYTKRLLWTLKVHEVDEDKIKTVLPLKIPKIALDERGRNLTSPQFADLIQAFQNQGHNSFGLIIGGADGLDPQFRESCDHVISLGAMTWPHKMVRFMIIEQLYRAQQILSGHPYHRV